MERWGAVAWESMARAFARAGDLVVNAAGKPDLGAVSDMSHMFRGTQSFDGHVGGWDVSTVTDMSAMFAGVQLSTASYDALLSGWGSLILQDDVAFDAGSSQYCEAVWRQAIVDRYGWTITDGGPSASCPP